VSTEAGKRLNERPGADERPPHEKLQKPPEKKAQDEWPWGDKAHQLPRRRVTLKDVAKAANVSITTASRALADYWDVSPTTKARVREVARKLGYTPNVIAQSLVRKQPTLLGAYIVDDGIPLAEQPFFLPVVCGVRDRAAELGQHVLLLAKPPSGETSLATIVKGTHVGGLVVMGLTEDHPELLELARLGIPTVTIDITPRGDRMVMITSDNVVQAAAVTSHLIEQGCERILFLGGKRNTAVHQAREQGYREALRRHGFPSEAARVVYGDFSRQKAYEAVLAAWREAPFDAVFAASDLMAAGAMSALAELGLNVPADVAVAGYDDLAIARHLNPPLTTVRQDPVAMGREAVDALKRLASEEVVSRVIEVKSRLVVRASSLKFKSDSSRGGTVTP